MRCRRFEFFRDFAREDDIEGQIEQREKAWWGRLYINNFPFSIQYFRGHFGGGAGLGEYTLLLSEPELMCDLNLFDAVMENQEKVKELKDAGQKVRSKRSEATSYQHDI